MTAFLITAYWPSASQKKIISHFGDYEQVKNLLYNKTPLGKTGCLRNPYFLLTGCLSIQFFDSPRRQSIRPPLVTYPLLCSTCVNYVMLCHVIGYQVLPIHPLSREAQDFPMGGNHFKHVPLLTYLAWLQPA